MFGFANRTDPVRPSYQIVIHLVVYTSLYVSIIGAAMVYISCLLQGLPFDPVAAAILMLVAFAVYNLNRGTDEGEMPSTIQNGIVHEGYETILFRSAIFAFILAFCLSASGFGSLLITTIPWSPESSTASRSFPLASGSGD